MYWGAGLSSAPTRTLQVPHHNHGGPGFSGGWLRFGGQPEPETPRLKAPGIQWHFSASGARSTLSPPERAPAATTRGSLTERRACAAMEMAPTQVEIYVDFQVREVRRRRFRPATEGEGAGWGEGGTLAKIPG